MLRNHAALPVIVFSYSQFMKSTKKPWALITAHGWFSIYYVRFRFHHSLKKGIASPWASVAEGCERIRARRSSARVYTPGKRYPSRITPFALNQYGNVVLFY